MTTQFTNSGSNYKTTKLIIKGNVWSVLVVSGTCNYVSILKVTNNRYRSCGKQFKNFDAAQENYKCVEMKMALLKIETNLI
jgi:hypothetical protein